MTKFKIPFRSSLVSEKESSSKAFSTKSRNEKSDSTRSFKYYGSDANGEKSTGKIEAASFAEAKYRLESSGLSVINLSEVKPWWTLEFGSSIPQSEILQFCRQLSSFAKTGIPLSRGLAILETSTTDKKLRSAIVDINSEIVAGGTLSEGIQHQGKIFPHYFVPIISASERTGKIEEALETLNSYLERDIKSRRAVKSAMSYPMVLIALTLVAITTLSIVVLPRFESFFASLEVELPLPTRMLLVSTRFVADWWWAMGLVIAMFIALILWAKQEEERRIFLDRAKLKLPLIGGFATLVATERFCRVLATLVRSQVALPEALLLAGKGTSNLVFERAVRDAHVQVLNGAGLADPLSKHRCFPEIAIQIFRVGEESGNLDSQLLQASSFYSEELDFRLKNFTSLIEPIVLVLLGGGIGFVAVALISAMYGIYSGVQG